jgi:hypothetical protein
MTREESERHVLPDGMDWQDCVLVQASDLGPCDLMVMQIRDESVEESCVLKEARDFVGHETSQFLIDAVQAVIRAESRTQAKIGRMIEDDRDRIAQQVAESGPED